MANKTKKATDNSAVSGDISLDDVDITGLWGIRPYRPKSVSIDDLFPIATLRRAVKGKPTDRQIEVAKERRKRFLSSSNDGCPREECACESEE